MSLCQKLYNLLEQQDYYYGYKLYWLNYALAILIIVNVFAVILESEHPIYKRYRLYFDTFEIFSVFIFTVEYLIRLWLSPVSAIKAYQKPVLVRLRYMLSPLALVDLMALLPFYISLLLDINDLRLLLSLRLLRILKLTRYSHSLGLLIHVIKQEAENLLSALLILGLLTLLAATGMYLAEGHLQPEVFGSIPRALWWAIVTLATVGYGDVIPLTLAGKLFAGLVIMIGVAVAALPSAILASGLINELKRRRNVFRLEVMQLLMQPDIDFADLRHLQQLRHKIGLSHADAHLIYEDVKRTSQLNLQVNCPYCDNPLKIQQQVGHRQPTVLKTTQQANED
jgi:voltage-gated potassium channel